MILKTILPSRDWTRDARPRASNFTPHTMTTRNPRGPRFGYSRRAKSGRQSVYRQLVLPNKTRQFTSQPTGNHSFRQSQHLYSLPNTSRMSMKAVVFHGPKKVTVEERPLPKFANSVYKQHIRRLTSGHRRLKFPTDVICKVEYAALCGRYEASASRRLEQSANEMQRASRLPRSPAQVSSSQERLVSPN